MADEPKKKLIIDEDWKSQVQAEKEAQRSKQTNPAEEDTAATSDAGAAPVEQPQQAADHAGGIPEASLPLLLSMLATQALISMGQVPHPATGKPEFMPEEAKHFIDLLGMLETKTEGNRTAEESLMLRNLLHELRMAFISTGGAAATGGQPPE